MSAPPPLAADAEIRLARELGVSSLVGRILWARGFRTAHEARRHLEPQLSDLHDPFLLADADRAARRIRRAVSRRETVLVYGDYDVDGLTALAVFVHYLRIAGADVRTYVPNRTRESYSLNRGGLEAIAQCRAGLVITTDSGVSSHEPIAALARDGVDVLVTDHHEVGDEGLPPAHAVVNPKRPDCGYPFKGLCGAGVAFKIVSAVAATAGEDAAARDRMRAFALDALAFVALGTVADLVPLVGENRALVSFGLKVLEGTAHPGLHALRAESRLLRTPIRARDVGFRLTPKINAAGRMGRVEEAVRLLLCEDSETGRDAAKVLERLNRTRRATQVRIETEVRRQVDGTRRPGIHFATGCGWEPGVLGIVAGALARETGRPCVVVSVLGPTARGSARSPAGGGILATLRKHVDLFDSLGGHADAAGFELPAENLALLAERLATERTHDVRTPAGVRPEAWVKIRDLVPPAVRDLERLEPFGVGNPPPVFGTTGVRLGGLPERSRLDPSKRELFASAEGASVRVLLSREAIERVSGADLVSLAFEARFAPGTEEVVLDASPIE